MGKRLLVIDDDRKLNELLQEYLQSFGFEVQAVTHPEEGLKRLRQEVPDLVVLDLMLPGMDGFEVCKQIRQYSSIPVIMLTARGDVTDRIVGLEIGADDYLSKPFEPRELVARIQSILRRTGAMTIPKNQLLKFGTLEIDIEKRHVTLENQMVELTTMEFELLLLFVRHPGKVFNRDQLLDELRGIDYDAFNRSMDILISRLRHKLKDDPKRPRWLKTIWGTGYVFIGENPHEEA